MLGKCSTTELHPHPTSSLYKLIILGICYSNRKLSNTLSVLPSSLVDGLLIFGLYFSGHKQHFLNLTRSPVSHPEIMDFALDVRTACVMCVLYVTRNHTWVCGLWNKLPAVDPTL
jgi:hypothetical protein